MMMMIKRIGLNLEGGVPLFVEVYIKYPFFFFLYFHFVINLDIFCGWMPEFEDKAIKL